MRQKNIPSGKYVHLKSGDICRKWSQACCNP